MKEKIKNEWHPQVIKWQEVYHNLEYTKENNNHKYIVLEHETIILYCTYTGETKTISHKVIEIK